MNMRAHLETLSEIIEMASQTEKAVTARMLRTLGGHISFAADKDLNQVTINELTELRPILRRYLARKQEAGALRPNSVRSYMNYFRILLQKAQTFGTTRPSPEIQKLWDPILQAVWHEYGSRDIVRNAVNRRIQPKDFSDEHLRYWSDQMAKNGRHPAYVRARTNAFRRRISEAGLTSLLPKLSFGEPRPAYGIPLESLPEPLKSQATVVLEWKLAPYVRGRPNRYRCRPVTVNCLKRLFCEIAGYAQLALGKTPETLNELLSEEIISGFTEWQLVDRQVNSRTVLDRLRTIPPLGRHPLFKGCDFGWVRDIISDLPPYSESKVKENKQRKFVRFDILAKVPGQLLEKAEATTNMKKKAILIRNALLIQFLLVLAWRQRNIRECRLAPSSEGGNIFKEEIPALSTMALPVSAEKIVRANPNAVFWQISFSPEETKSKRPVRAVLPCQVVPLLERYLKVRPYLLRTGETDPGTLFLSDHGKSLTAGILAHHVKGIVSRTVGKLVNPHLFRDIHSEAWLADGQPIGDLSNQLWHLDPGFTRRVYGGMFDESHGTKGVEEWLDKKNFDFMSSEEGRTR